MSVDRHRALPTWMSTSTRGERKKEPLKSGKKPKVARSVFYCLNEKELVEAAVSVLTHAAAARQDVELRTDRKVPDRAEGVATTTRDKQTDPKTTTTNREEEEWSDLGDAAELTYISETDVDVTEVETLPYTEIRQGQRSEPVQEADKGAEPPPAAPQQVEAPQHEEDDGLQLVREIFFT